MKEKFYEIFGENYEQEFFSPGRVNLIGEHIDYNGGVVLPMGINIGTYGYLRMRSDNNVRIFSLNFQDVGIIEFNLNEIEKKLENSWGNYIKAMIYTFNKHGYKIKTGFDLLINGTIPNSSGLSSSASLEVLLGRIFIDNFKFDITNVELASLAQEAENDYIGVKCGIMDQFIIANAKENSALKINTDTLHFDIVNLNTKDYQIVILNSNKKRGLVDSAYNERRENCESALRKIQKRISIKSLCELNLEQLYTIELSEVEQKRVRHVISENIRVLEAVDALEQGDVRNLGRLFNESHESLRIDYEVSCAELDFIVKSALECGAIGARMTGAGFGGCAVALMKQKDLEKLESIKKVYQQKYGQQLEVLIANSSDCAKKIY